MKFESKTTFLIFMFSDIPRPRKRLTELLFKTAMDKPSEKDEQRWQDASKQWALKFLRSPVEFVPDQKCSTRVGSVKFAVNRLEVTTIPKVSMSTYSYWWIYLDMIVYCY